MKSVVQKIRNQHRSRLSSLLSIKCIPVRAGSAALFTRHRHGHVSDASCSDVTTATTSREGSGMSRSIMTLGACVTSAVPHALTTCHYTARDYSNVSTGFQRSVSDTPLDRAQVAAGIATTSTRTYEMMGYSLASRLPGTRSCARRTQGQDRCPRRCPGPWAHSRLQAAPSSSLATPVGLNVTLSQSQR